MKIEAKDRRKFVELRELKIGECFFCDGEYYMVTDEVGDNYIKVVNLSTGEIEKWGDRTTMISVEAKVVVE